MSNSEATTGAKLTGPGQAASAQPPPGPSGSLRPEPARPAPLRPPTGDVLVSTPIARMPTVRGHAVGGGLHGTVVGGATALTRLGRYHVVGRIATGGMAEVYLAVHGELAGFRTPVVLKKVLPHLACNPEFIDMFLDEARIASLLDHPNVVRIYEVGRSDSEYFLAMELVQGKPLQALLRRAQDTKTNVLEPRLAAFIVAQAAAGLHHAHNLTDPLGNTLGLVHRDVSPQNILLSFEGSVKVIDFGVARALGRITETQTGGMKGKFGYMSPEQARGEDLDLRADIFALGVVLWEAVTGRRLFQRDNDLATMRALIYDPIPRPSTVAPSVVEGLESIIMRALAREAGARFQTARDLAMALERFVVQSGGASASDLGGVMKSHFAQDYVTWRQTIRSAVNLPAQASETGITPAVAGAAATPKGWPARLRLPHLLGIGATFLALLSLVLLLTRSSGPEAAGPLDPAAPGQPSIEPATLPLPPRAAAPFGPLPEEEEATTEDPANTAAAGAAASPTGKIGRRKPAAPSRASPPRAKPLRGSDRRPNPF